MEHFEESFLNETNNSNHDFQNKKLSIKPKVINNKHWNITKNVRVSYAFSKNIFKKLKTNHSERKTKATPTIQQITPLYLDERDWFKKKCEREIGKFSTRKETQISNIERCLRLQELIRCSKEIRMYREYVQPPRPENVPDIVWNGPLMKQCGCPNKDCECRGNILLPPKHIGFATRYTWRPTYYLRALTCFKKWQPPEPQKTFAQRLQEAVEAETDACKQLKEMGVLDKRGPEFCINRCFFYQMPEAESYNEYITLKQQLLETYKNRKPPPVIDTTVTIPEEEEIPIIDGFYRSLSTQSTTGPNGEFEMGKISHVLFAKLDESKLRDIEGKELKIRSYKEFFETDKPLTINGKLDNLFSFKGIRSQFSKLTSNLISSIIEIKDTGIPVNSQGTQDPPLNNRYQSIIEIPLKSNCVHDTETCPCCKYYKTSKIVTPNLLEENTMKDDYKMIENSSDRDAELIDSQKKKISSEVKNEERLAEKYNNILVSSEQKDISQQSVTQTKNLTENELSYVESKLVEESSNNKSTTLAEENKNTAKISEAKLNNISSVDQTNNVYDSVNNLDDSINMPPHNDVNNINSDNDRIDELKFDENKSDKSLLSPIDNKNFENKLEQDLSIAENKQVIKDKEIKTNLNENNPTTSSKVSTPKSQNNVILNEQDYKQVNINSPEKYGASSSKADVHMLLNTNISFKFKNTQKPSLKYFASTDSQRVGLRNRVKRALSYDNIKLHIKKSFQKTSSAFSALFQCVHFTSGLSIKHSEDHKNNKDTKEKRFENNAQDNFINVSNRKDSKISEEEMFSLQYNSKLMTDTESSGLNDKAVSE